MTKLPVNISSKKQSAKTAKKGSNDSESAKQKVVGSKEIDDLFRAAKKKSNERKDDAIDENKAQKPKKFRVQVENRSSSEAAYGIMKSANNTDIINPEAPLERIDAESGLPVYKAHLLKVGEGGGTPLCPFDCNCCFW